jgi:bifunctional non-homologous end joining protein LigD
VARALRVSSTFDLLHLDGEDLILWPLLERKARLADVLKGAPAGLQLSNIMSSAGALPSSTRDVDRRAEGIVSKRADAPYRPLTEAARG